jgi:hypothetical protein
MFSEVLNIRGNDTTEADNSNAAGYNYHLILKSQAYRMNALGPQFLLRRITRINL